MSALTGIRNIGPAMAEAFAKAGITDAETLEALGADAAYAALLESGQRAHFIPYYALVMGLQGRAWNDCTPDEKAALRVRFDAIKARVGTVSTPEGLERILDRIGTGQRR